MESMDKYNSFPEIVLLNTILNNPTTIPITKPYTLNIAVRHNVNTRINFMAYPISKLACEYVPNCNYSHI